MEDNAIPNNLCPICEKHQFSDYFEICPVCFWENDDVQNAEPDFNGGANNLSLNDYKKRWNKLTNIMPKLMDKYKVSKTNISHWEYDELNVPRENIKEFVNSLTEQKIGIGLSFYNVCQKYGYDYRAFVGFPFVKARTTAGRNRKSLNIVFSKNPIKTCKKYRLKQILEILEKSTDVKNTWQELTPYICVEPNPMK